MRMTTSTRFNSLAATCTFGVTSNGDDEVRRVPAASRGTSEDVAEGVNLFVPGDPAKSSRQGWDLPFWSIG